MNSWQKNITLWLIALLALTTFASLSVKASAAAINFKYAGTQSANSPANIKFSLYNNSIFYLQSKDLSVGFSIGMDRYSNAFLHSVSYKASWQSASIEVYKYSINDPANRQDDDPNPQESFQGQVDLTNVPLGNQQIEITVTTWEYSTRIGSEYWSYWVYTSSGSSTLNFTVESQPIATPKPTFSDQSGILWRTDVAWNLEDSPARGLWDTDIMSKRRTWTPPIILDGVMYAGATSSVTLNRYMSPSITWVNVYAFDIRNGEQLWSWKANYTGISNLAVSDGRVFFGTNDGYNELWRTRGDCFNALDAKNGKLLWQTPCDIFYASPVANNGRVFINSDHSILAFSPADGKILWNYTAPDIILYTPTVANNILCVPAYDHTLYAINTQDGSKIWSLKTENGFSSATAINDVVYAPSDDGKVYALDAKTGNSLWSCDTTSPEFKWVNYTSHSTPVYDNGKLYFTGRSEQHIHIQNTGEGDICEMFDTASVFALDASNGNKIWNYTKSNNQFESPVAVANGVVYTQSWRSLVGFNSQTGALVWNYTQSDLSPTSQSTITNDIIYVGYSDGQIYALRAPGGGIAALQVQGQDTWLLIGIVASLALAFVALVVVYRTRK